jgi:hypothetical protein
VSPTLSRALVTGNIAWASPQYLLAPGDFPAELRLFFDLGVDDIFTDDADVAVAVRAKASADTRPAAKRVGQISSSLRRTGVGTKNHSWASTSYNRLSTWGRRRTTRGSWTFDAKANVQNAPG